LRSRLGWPEDAFVVLSLRNFRPYTNLDVLVRAFARVAADEPRLRLLMASRGGSIRDEIEQLVDDLGVRDRTVVEQVAHADLPRVVAAADIAVTIADTDSTPASLLETMASRLPVVAGRAPSIDEWVDQGEGAELIDGRSEDAVADALRKLVGDPELRRRYGERNERVVRERLSEPGPALEALYRELLNGTR
jgi:glycosyltransferase involved in cell wall biosynthesis